MAAGSLAKPGSKYGPCKKPCEHRDCAETRRMAAQVCRFCQGTIGYDKRFYKDPDTQGELVHAICLEESVEEERKQQLTALREAQRDDDGINMDLGISSGRHLA